MWLGELIALDMTPLGGLGRKPQHKQTKSEESKGPGETSGILPAQNYYGPISHVPFKYM